MAGVKGKSGSGGARPNAGRKAKAEKFPTQVQAAEQRCADRLPNNLANLERLADGEAEQTEEEWLAAGTVTIGKGAYVKPAFPDLPPDELVLVRRKTVTYGPDVKANIYLTDRALGRPESADEMKIAQAVEAELEAFIDSIEKNLDPQLRERVFAALPGNIGARARASSGGGKTAGSAEAH